MSLCLLVASLGVLIPIALAGQELHPCTGDRFGPGAQCGRFPVFEDRAAASGRRIEINFVVLPASEPQGREPVFLFAGGPGQGSTELVNVARGPMERVRRARDIVLVDQRGTGESNPLRCPSDMLRNPQSAFGSLFAPEVFRECRKRLASQADLRFYTSDLAVADLDDIRAWLRHDRIILWGGSYGTRLALAYLRRHPDHVRAAVLDGVVPPDFHAPIGYAASAQQSLDRVFQDCDAQPDCRAAFPSLRTEFAALRDRFGAGPVTAKVRRPDRTEANVRMTWGDFGYAVRGILYNAGATSQLPLMIHRAAGSGDLSEFAQRYYDRAAGFEQSFADGLHLAVFCAEDVPFIRDQEVGPATAGTFLGSYLVDQYRAACRLWQRAEVASDVHQPIRAQVPVLLYSGHYDPVTPPATGEAVARALTQSRHIVVRDQAHGSEFGCALSATVSFLLEPKLEGLGPVCEGAGPIRFVVP